MTPKMQVELISISPVSFELAKIGDLVAIRRKNPNHNEYRGNLESPTDAFLIFKGVTKIGMVPTDFVKKNDAIKNIKKARIISMDKINLKVSIELIIV